MLVCTAEVTPEPSPGWTVPYRRDAPVPSPPLWSFPGLSAECPGSGEPRTGPSTPAVASPVLSRVEGSPPSVPWQFFA